MTSCFDGAWTCARWFNGIVQESGWWWIIAMRAYGCLAHGMRLPVLKLFSVESGHLLCWKFNPEQLIVLKRELQTSYIYCSESHDFANYRWLARHCQHITLGYLAGARNIPTPSMCFGTRTNFVRRSQGSETIGPITERGSVCEGLRKTSGLQRTWTGDRHPHLIYVPVACDRRTLKANTNGTCYSHCNTRESL